MTRHCTGAFIALNQTAAPAETRDGGDGRTTGRKTAMPIQSHEEATVYGTACVLHPLAGRPEFKGVNDTPDGPVALIEDGPLALRVDDEPTLMRWAEQCTRAATALAEYRERLARHESEASA